MACDNFLPRFQPQNPAMSGYRYGWQSCTAFAGAMAAEYDTCGAKKLTGEMVRNATNEPVPQTGDPGLSIAQVEAALLKYDVDLDVRYYMEWNQFAAAITAGHGALLALNYGPIADSRFDAGRGFRGGHAVTVLPGWLVMDPLADGRALGVYKYRGEAYPTDLLRKAAGSLRLSDGSTVGDGLVFAALTRDNRTEWRVTIRPVPPATRRLFYTYELNSSGLIVGYRRDATAGFTAACSAPKRHRWANSTNTRNLVRITSGGRAGRYVDASFAKEIAP